MTEQEWLASADPAAMLHFTNGAYGSLRIQPPDRLSDRKLRLFAVACCRSVWPLLTDPRSRRAVEVAERFADGLATEEELLDAFSAACDVRQELGTIEEVAAWDAAGICSESAAEAVSIITEADQSLPPVALCDILRDIAGNPWRPVTLPRGDCSWRTPTVLALAEAAYQTRAAVKCDNCKKHPGTCDKPIACSECGGDGHLCERGIPLCVSCNGTGRQYQSCPFCYGTGGISAGMLDNDRLLVLADALEDAGCCDAAILNHLRGLVPCDWCRGDGFDSADQRNPNECRKCKGTGWLTPAEPAKHYRGCHVLDALLGKE